MKKLRKIRIQNAVLLKDSEVKAIYGGSGGNDSGVCAYSITHSGAAICLTSGSGAAGAEFMAGLDGWWCCNCQEAIDVCRN